MEALALIIIKAVATTFIKYYIASLMAPSGVTYNSAELGYKVPKWYMNPGKQPAALYAYGTSTEGDEFVSLEKAQISAIKQMVDNIRLANQHIINDKISYNKNSIKQRRLVDLFVKGQDLEDFVHMNAVADQKQLVKTGSGDMRAFVRISLKPKLFYKYQEKQIQALKTKIVHQKSDDILAEMENELKNYDTQSTNTTNQIDAAPKPAKLPDTDKLTPTPLKPSGFENLEKELDSSSAD
jgi:hypothetical protein